tara:strand:- start:221 stop:700 length:480 start_codon:yes stop_codon:yes gene_type:complete
MTEATEFESLLFASLALQKGEERKKRMLRISIMKLMLDLGVKGACKVFESVTSDSMRNTLIIEMAKIQRQIKTEDQITKLYQTEMDLQFNLKKHSKPLYDEPSKFASIFDAQFNWFYDKIIDEEKDGTIAFGLKIIILMIIQFGIIMSPWVSIALLSSL